MESNQSLKLVRYSLRGRRLTVDINTVLWIACDLYSDGLHLALEKLTELVHKASLHSHLNP